VLHELEYCVLSGRLIAIGHSNFVRMLVWRLGQLLLALLDQPLSPMLGRVRRLVWAIITSRECETSVKGNRHVRAHGQMRLSGFDAWDAESGLSVYW
jgi:hypothetical protein